MKKNKIIYQLTVEDVQSVAEEVLERTLSDKELKKVANKIADFIPWFDSTENTFLALGINSEVQEV